MACLEGFTQDQRADSNVQFKAVVLPWSVIGFRKASGWTHSARQSSAINKRPKGIYGVALSRSHIRLVAEVEAMRTTAGSQKCVPSPARAPRSCPAICCSPRGETACLALGGGRHPVGAHFLFCENFFAKLHRLLLILLSLSFLFQKSIVEAHR